MSEEKLTLEHLEQLQLHMEAGLAFLAADIDGKDYDLIYPRLEDLIDAARDGLLARADAASRHGVLNCGPSGSPRREGEVNNDSKPSPLKEPEELAKRLTTPYSGKGVEFAKGVTIVRADVWNEICRQRDEAAALIIKQARAIRTERDAANYYARESCEDHNTAIRLQEECSGLEEQIRKQQQRIDELERKYDSLDRAFDERVGVQRDFHNSISSLNRQLSSSQQRAERLAKALAWALPSAELDVEQLGNALSGPSITMSMMEQYEEAKAELAKARAALAEEQAK